MENKNYQIKDINGKSFVPSDLPFGKAYVVERVGDEFILKFDPAEEKKHLAADVSSALQAYIFKKNKGRKYAAELDKIAKIIISNQRELEDMRELIRIDYTLSFSGLLGREVDKARDKRDTLISLINSIIEVKNQNGND